MKMRMNAVAAALVLAGFGTVGQAAPGVHRLDLPGVSVEMGGLPKADPAERVSEASTSALSWEIGDFALKADATVAGLPTSPALEREVLEASTARLLSSMGEAFGCEVLPGGQSLFAKDSGFGSAQALFCAGPGVAHGVMLGYRDGVLYQAQTTVAAKSAKEGLAALAPHVGAIRAKSITSNSPATTVFKASDGTLVGLAGKWMSAPSGREGEALAVSEAGQRVRLMEGKTPGQDGKDFAGAVLGEVRTACQWLSEGRVFGAETMAGSGFENFSLIECKGPDAEGSGDSAFVTATRSLKDGGILFVVAPAKGRDARQKAFAAVRTLTATSGKGGAK